MTSMGMYIHVPIPLAIIGSMRIVYLFTYRRGLRRCLSRLLSDARASERGTGNRSDSHAFSLYMLVRKMFALFGGSQSRLKENIFINLKYYKDEKEFVYYDGFLS